MFANFSRREYIFYVNSITWWILVFVHFVIGCSIKFIGFAISVWCIDVIIVNRIITRIHTYTLENRHRTIQKKYTHINFNQNKNETFDKSKKNPLPLLPPHTHAITIHSTNVKLTFKYKLWWQYGFVFLKKSSKCFRISGWRFSIVRVRKNYL